MPPRIVACPQCSAAVEWSAAATWRPFCSNRCKTIDLGGWASEAYRVPAERLTDDDSQRGPIEDDLPRDV